MRKMLTGLLAMALFLTMFAGGAAFAQEAKTIYANSGPIEFFFHPWLNPGQYVTQKVLWDTLIGCDADMNPTGGRLAESYALSEDGTTLSFVMRDGVTWHDGEPVTAEDVKWSIEYSLKTGLLHTVFHGTFQAIDGYDAYMSGEVDEITGVKIDGRNIDITFTGIAPDALITFTQFPPLPRKYFEGENPALFQQTPYFQNPVGSGPFKVGEVQMNSYCVLVPFEGYWDGVADFNIQLSPSSAEADENLVVNAMAGKIDYAYTKTYTDALALEQVEGVDVHTVNVKYTRLFWVNKFPKKDGTPSPFVDPRTRLAIAYAIDMDAICESVFNGAALPANSLTPDGGSKVDGLNDYKYDPDKARALLAEAGWDPNTELDVVYYYTDQQTVDLMAILQYYLSEVGIKINARLITGDTDTQLWSRPADMVNGPREVDWDLAYGAVSALSLHEYYDRAVSTAATNSHTPYVKEFDDLINATNASMDAGVQAEAFFELQKYENEYLPNIPLYYQPVWVVVSDKLAETFAGFPAIGNPQYRWDWNIQNWTF